MHVFGKYSEKKLNEIGKAMKLAEKFMIGLEQLPPDKAMTAEERNEHRRLRERERRAAKRLSTVQL
jgi:hypothetical protein